MAEIYTVECSEILQRCATGNTALEQIGHNNVGEKCTVPNQFFSKASNRKNYCCFCSYEKLVWYCTLYMFPPQWSGDQNKKCSAFGGTQLSLPFKQVLVIPNYLGLSHGG